MRDSGPCEPRLLVESESEDARLKSPCKPTNSYVPRHHNASAGETHLPMGEFKHSDVQDRLYKDKGAASWHTKVKGSQVAPFVAQETPRQYEQYLHPGAAARGSSRWVDAPHTHKIDKEIIHQGQTSPRRRAAHITPAMADSALAVGMGTAGLFAKASSSNTSPGMFHRRNFEHVQALDADASPNMHIGTSIMVPSMSPHVSPRTHRPPPSNGDDGSLMPSPHRRNAHGHFNATSDPRSSQERPFWPTNMPMPTKPAGADAQLKSFEGWMASQKAPTSTLLGHNKVSFSERLHQEGQLVPPDPFNKGTGVSPRVAGAGRLAEEGQVSPRQVREHHKELWPVGERSNHPHLGPNGVGSGSCLKPSSGILPVMCTTEAGQNGDRHTSPSFLHHQLSGYRESRGLTTKDSLTDASSNYGGSSARSTGGSSAHSSPTGHRRGRSDLDYLGQGNATHETRQGFFAREREVASRSESHTYGRRQTNATVPNLDAMRENRSRRQADALNDFMLSGRHSPNLRGTSDITGASDRQFRMVKAAHERDLGGESTISSIS